MLVRYEAPLIIAMAVCAKLEKLALWKNIGPARSLPPETNSKESLALIRHWLHDCQDKHPSCKTAADTTLPTRVIDVGTSPGDMCLYISKGEEGSYAALSHCWGGHKPVSTTTRTLKEYEWSLHFGTHSKTFADAAEVTRALGLRYLWIDSSCIIQDDTDDWTIEVANMSRVYRNATITLSVDRADDASEGLFGNSSTRALAHEVYSISTEGLDGKPVMVHAKKRSKRSSDPDSSPHSSLNTEPGKLSSRAWVVRERILSPRMVHFYKGELVWSCYSQQRCECRLMAGASSSGTFRRLVASEGSKYSLIHEWTNLVSQLTAKDLTDANDRLPAISGLAALMNQYISSRYLAGIWACDMDYSLLWIGDHKKAKGTPIHRMRVALYAPSWSWTTIVGPIKYVNRHLGQLSYRRSGEDEIKPFRAVRATTAPTSSFYGPVKHGFVTIKGQVLPVHYDVAGQAWRPSPQEWNDLSGLNLDGEPGSNTLPVQHKPQFVYDVLYESPELIPDIFASREFVLLRAATYIWGGTWSAAPTKVVALLLHQVSEVPLAYRRVGIVLCAFCSKTVWGKVPTKSIIIC